MNEKCKEMVYVVSEKGNLTIDNETYEIEKGETILILPNEKFYWIGEDLNIFILCTPAWYPGQYKSIN